MRHTLYYIRRVFAGPLPVRCALLLLLLFVGCHPGIARQHPRGTASRLPRQELKCGCAASLQPKDKGNPVFQRLILVEIEKKYAFVCYDSNHLFIGSDSSVMDGFFKKWTAVAATGQGNLNIMHLGSSHVQAGTFPHQVRRHILRNNFDRVADRGMIFPYSAARNCNNPSDYTVHCAQSVDLCRNA